MATIRLEECLTFPVRWEASNEPKPTDRLALSEFPIQYQNKTGQPVILSIDNFKIEGYNSCVFIDREGPVQPGAVRRRAVLAYLYEHRNPVGSCRRVMVEEYQNNHRLLHTPTRRSSRINYYYPGDKYGNGNETPWNVAYAARNVERKASLLRRYREVDYSFTVSASYTDAVGKEIKVSREFTDDVIIPHGAPKNFCVHFRGVDFDD